MILRFRQPRFLWAQIISRCTALATSGKLRPGGQRRDGPSRFWSPGYTREAASSRVAPPSYRVPFVATGAAVAPEQREAELGDTTDFESAPAAAAATGKLTWPKQMREQVAAVRQALSQSPLPADALAAQFKRSPKVAVQAVLDALEELGMVQQADNSYRLAS